MSGYLEKEGGGAVSLRREIEGMDGHGGGKMEDGKRGKEKDKIN